LSILQAVQSKFYKRSERIFLAGDIGGYICGMFYKFILAYCAKHAKSGEDLAKESCLKVSLDKKKGQYRLSDLPFKFELLCNYG